MFDLQQDMMSGINGENEEEKKDRGGKKAAEMVKLLCISFRLT